MRSSKLTSEPLALAVMTFGATDQLIESATAISALGRSHDEAVFGGFDRRSDHAHAVDTRGRRRELRIEPTVAADPRIGALLACSSTQHELERHIGAHR